jgi:uncharacterized protein YkwD
MTTGKRHVSSALALLLPLLAGACGGGGAGATAGTPVTVVAAPPSNVSPAPEPSPGATAGAVNVTSTPASTWADRSAALFAAKPDVATCRPGALASSVKADILARINAIRALHHLPAVTYSDADDAQAMETAMMMAANGQVSHNPANSWKCWTQKGYDGAASSDLYGGTISPNLVWSSEDDYVAGWMNELNNIFADNVGHRRWILDPFLGKIAYGRVSQVMPDGSRTDAAALKVFNFTGDAKVSGDLPDYVAYPYGDYPARYFDARSLLSFSVVADKDARSGNAAVDFSAATVTVRDAGGNALSVSNISFDTTAYGLPNNIQWRVAGLKAGTSYSVTIDGVTVGGVRRHYDYGFRVVG